MEAEYLSFRRWNHWFMEAWRKYRDLEGRPMRKAETWDEAIARHKRDLGMHVVPKHEGRLMILIAYTFGWLLGGPKYFLSNWITTIGRTCYWPDGGSKGSNEAVHTLEHEAEHVRQWIRHGVWFALSYLFVLPAVFTFRGYWEFQASVAEMAKLAERIGFVPDSWIERRLEHYTTMIPYWYMCPFKGWLRKKFHVKRNLIELKRQRLIVSELCSENVKLKRELETAQSELVLRTRNGKG